MSSFKIIFILFASLSNVDSSLCESWCINNPTRLGCNSICGHIWNMGKLVDVTTRLQSTELQLETSEELLQDKIKELEEKEEIINFNTGLLTDKNNTISKKIDSLQKQLDICMDSFLDTTNEWILSSTDLVECFNELSQCQYVSQTQVISTQELDICLDQKLEILKDCNTDRSGSLHLFYMLTLYLMYVMILYILV